MERKHEPIWRDNQNTTSLEGGDNDNHFIGFNWLLKGNNYLSMVS